MKKLITAIFIFFISVQFLRSQTMNVSYKSISRYDAAMNDSVTASYPQVDFGPEALMGLRGIAQDINSSIDTMINGMIERFTSEVTSLTVKNVNGIGSTLNITSTAGISGGTLLSSAITEFKNLSGNAHPLTTVTSFNYSITSTGILSLSNLFTAGSDYLNYISAYCINELQTKARKEGYDNIDDMITRGASPEKNNFSNWIIRDDSLKIVFNPYRVAPYVFGIQTVSIPLSSMMSFIDPKGPLEYMFR